MAVLRRFASLALLLLLGPLPISAHGEHNQIPVAADADWATKHMAGTRHEHAMIERWTDYSNRGTPYKLLRCGILLQPARLRFLR